MLVFLFSFYSSAKDHPDFTKSSRGVTWKGYRLKGIDPRSFESNCPPEVQAKKGDALFCVTDAKNVFLGRTKQGSKEPQIDSFPRSGVKEIGKNHFMFGQTVFYKDLSRPIPNADFATFEELEEENESGIDSRRQWAHDHRDVYCAGQPVTGISSQELAFWPFLSWDCKDLVSSQGPGLLPSTGYIRDDKAVFVYVDCRLQMKLQEADPSTFNVPNILFPSRARDGKGHFYNCGNLSKYRKR